MPLRRARAKTDSALCHASRVEVWPRAAAVLALGLTTLLALDAGAQVASPASAPVAAKTMAVSRPLWVDLKAEQQEALRPLEPHWDSLTEAHRRKWIAVSRNFGALTPDGQQTLHSRMSEWAKLSYQQRAQARLNFAEIQGIATDRRKSKWDAYQALSEEERANLAKRAAMRPPGAAMPVQPVPASKLAVTPAVARGHTPRIDLAPPASPAAAAAPAATAPKGAPVPPEAQLPPPETPTAAQ